MNLNLLTLSAAASALLTAATPMTLSSMSTDNGGNKLAIDAYSDGAGVLVINQASDTKFDNSTMNKLVFKYGDVAKSSNTTLKNQVTVLSSGATALEKADATSKLEIAKVVINPPTTGASCDDGNANTTGDVWTGSVCAGIQTVFPSCLAIKTAIPSSVDGQYTIDTDGETGIASFPVYCDMTTDGGGWTRLFYQNYANSKDTTSINLLASGRPSSFTLNQYEERVASNINMTEVLVAINTGAEVKIKLSTQLIITNLLKTGVTPSALVSGNQAVTTSGRNLTTGTVFSGVPIMFYSSGAIIGEWNGTYYAGANQWWTSNDSTNINLRFMSNGVAATAAPHYSSILVR